ncbi:MAG: dehydrogenase, partial [Gemmatimonadetes bacterium]|nr:dehydrogenase [Gemmatimonadota bacterium]
MATRTTRTAAPERYHGLTGEQLVGLYRIMVTARRIDDREISLKRQNRTFFQISGAGHEGVLVALAQHVKPGYDWFFLYYRDRALVLALGQKPLDHFLAAVGAADDPNTGGRQMPSHWASRELNIASSSSPTGTQFLQAVGAAEAEYRARLVPELREHLRAFHEDAIVVCTAGEGTTSEGEFWEAMNTACNLKLPILFVIEDNQYAISVPVEVQTAGASISRLLSGFPGLHIEQCDGTDVLESYDACGRAVRYVREGQGPALVHAHVIRPHSHSMSDDERAYKPPKERQEEARRDPLVRMRSFLLKEGIASEDELDRLEEDVVAEVAAAADEALGHPQAGPETATRYLYSEDVDPTGPDFDTEDSPQFEGEPLTMVDLLNACLRDEMERDPRILVFGEDVADASREDILDEVKGKGGVFKVTYGLQRRFGSVRVYNSPLAEANIVGRAIGLAELGLKPIPEIQFFDYIWPAMMQIRNELAT